MKTHTPYAAAALVMMLALPMRAVPKDGSFEPRFKRIIRVIKKLISTGDVMSPPNPAPAPPTNP